MTSIVSESIRARINAFLTCSTLHLLQHTAHDSYHLIINELFTAPAPPPMPPEISSPESPNPPDPH
jgi:hypothetical protein